MATPPPPPPPADISFPGDFAGPNAGRKAASRSYVFHVVDDAHDDGHAGHDTPTMLGFWIYLMSDCLIFGILFAVHAVLGQSYAAGPAPIDLFEIELVLIATFALLFSSITYGFAMINMQQRNKAMMLILNDMRSAGSMVWQLQIVKRAIKIPTIRFLVFPVLPIGPWHRIACAGKDFPKPKSPNP